MIIFTAIFSSVLAATSVAIIEPIDGETYNGDWLTVRAIVENENELPDSVHYTLNGESVIQVPRLNTDWPTYMQNYQNHGYSESPAVTDNTILWTAQVTGDSHEFPTPVVVDGLVYYPPDDGGAGSRDSLYCLDAATGTVIWKYRTGYTDDAVTVCDGYVYTPSDSLWCLDALTGDRIWAFGGANDRGGTPIVIDNNVFCAAGIDGQGSADSSIVYRLDALTGDVVWSQSFPGIATSCMGAWDDMLIVPTAFWNNPAPIVALNRETGEIIWENYDSVNGYWDSSPVIVDGIVYIGDNDGYVRGIDTNTGETIWVTPISTAYIAATLSYHSGFLYLAKACIETSLGGIAWQQPYYQHGSSGIAGGLVSFAESVPDTASFITLNCSDGTEVWRYQTASGSTGLQSSPSIVDGVMYIAGTDWNLYAFGTGLKYTYLDDLYASVGSNELIVTSFDGGAVAADTINFTVTGTGMNLEPSHIFNLSASPNPFLSSATVSFELAEPSFTSVRIFDLAGRTVITLADSDLNQGSHTVQWNGCTDTGQFVSAGLYLCRIESGGAIVTTGLCLLR